jgi:predicted transcriptional regulator
MMKLNEIVETISAEIIYESDICRNQEILYAVAADLMSEVMIDTKDGSLIITGLINPQVIRTAEMMNAYAVLFVRDKDIPDNITELAKNREVTVMKTACTMFEACGRLYSAGLVDGQ